jgi:DNA-binding phage protein
MEEKKTYSEKLQELRKFLTERRLMTEVAAEAGVTTRTVYLAFEAKSPSELRGKRIKVIEYALAKRKRLEEIDSNLE